MAPPFKARKRRTRDYQHLPPLVAKKEFRFFFFSSKRAVGADRWMKETKEARERPPRSPAHTHTCTHTSPFSRTRNSNSFYFYSLCILNRGKLFLLGYSTLLRARHVNKRKGEGDAGGGGVGWSAHTANKKLKKNPANCGS